MNKEDLHSIIGVLLFGGLVLMTVSFFVYLLMDTVSTAPSYLVILTGIGTFMIILGLIIWDKNP